jgi:hypothetical protein
MFGKFTFIAFFALAFVAQASPHPPQQCQNQAAVRTTTVVRTVTVTSRTLPTPVKNGNQAEVRPGQPANNNAAPPPKSGNGANNATQPGKGNNGGNNNNNNNNNNKDPQKSLTLDARVIAHGFEKTGQEVPAAGQVASLTSPNNFINYCLLAPGVPITDGKQIQTGSCNPAPIGMIPNVDNQPSSKFSNPPNFGTIKAGQTFTIEMNIRGMQAGFFVNAQANYFGAPQQLNKQGQIKGHSHVVIERIDSFQQTKPTNPKVFEFFKGLNSPAQGGKLTATVDKGLTPGFFRLASINTAANHQPCIGPVAQHGSFDDAIYFAVTADGKPPKGQGNNGGNAAPPANPPKADPPKANPPKADPPKANPPKADPPKANPSATGNNNNQKQNEQKNQNQGGNNKPQQQQGNGGRVKRVVQFA